MALYANFHAASEVLISPDLADLAGAVGRKQNAASRGMHNLADCWTNDQRLRLVADSLAPDDCARDTQYAGRRVLVSEAHFAKGAALFRQSEQRDYAYVVRTGVVALHRSFADGRRVILAFALPGDFLGLLVGTAPGCSANAMGPVSASQISRAGISVLIDSDPNFHGELEALSAHDLSNAYDHMMRLSRCTARERIARFLIDLRSRWKRIKGEATYIALPMTREDIGNHVGLTIETVSRTFSLLARERIIEVDANGVDVLDIRRLKASLAI